MGVIPQTRPSSKVLIRQLLIQPDSAVMQWLRICRIQVLNFIQGGVNTPVRRIPPGDFVTEDSADLRSPETSPSAEFVQLFTHHQRRLFLYILSQVANPVDAEEILQETNVVIWSKSSRFQPGTNFLAWVSQIANFEVMKFRTRRKREKLRFSDEFLETVARENLERSEELETRRTALFDCLNKLRPKDRELIESRYAPGERGKHLAEKIGRSANSVYQSLGRIRRALLDCVERRLTAEAAP